MRTYARKMNERELINLANQWIGREFFSAIIGTCGESPCTQLYVVAGRDRSANEHAI